MPLRHSGVAAWCGSICVKPSWSTQRALRWSTAPPACSLDVAAAVAFLGIAPAGWFMPAIVVGSSASLAVLILFFSPWLVLGFAIDAVLLWAVLVSGWAPKATV